MAVVFKKQKADSLAKADISRKGSIDEPIVDLVHYINKSDEYFTTSSCSGRIYVYEERNEVETKKKGCTWLYTTHGMCNSAQVVEGLNASKGNAFLKFEPFILHVQCQTLDAAQLLHMVAVAAGFRNSGITVGKRGKIMVAVRSTHCLEVPVTHNGQLLVDHKYIEHLVVLANDKMKENFQRLQGFYEKLKNEITDKQSHHSSTNNTGLDLPRNLTVAKTQTVLPDTMSKISSENSLQNTLMQSTVLNSLTDDVDDIDELSLELFNSDVATNYDSCL